MRNVWSVSTLYRNAASAIRQVAGWASSMAWRNEGTAKRAPRKTAATALPHRIQWTVMRKLRLPGSRESGNPAAHDLRHAPLRIQRDGRVVDLGVRFASQPTRERLTAEGLGDLRAVTHETRDARGVQQEEPHAAGIELVHRARELFARRIAGTLEAEYFDLGRGLAGRRTRRTFEASAYRIEDLSRRERPESLPQSHRLGPPRAIPETVEHQRT